MKKFGFFLLFVSTFFAILIYACKKEPEKGSKFETPLLVGAEIDIQNVESTIGCKFKILKTETIGYTPLHKFYWVCLKKGVANEKVKELADAIIKETITQKPRTFHSFTIHFFWEDELAGSVEKSRRFARANFLPEGSWLKVGRVPLDDYKRYKLTFAFLNNKSQNSDIKKLVRKNEQRSR
jgi:hypothetical protein